jgi:hypothetical protein
MSNRTTTPAQLGFIRSLLTARQDLLELTDVEAFIAEQRYEELTVKAASALIDELKKIPSYVVVDKATGEIAAPSYRRNAYGSKCRTCGKWVEPQAGRIEKSGTQWLTFHLDGECPEIVAPAAPVVEKAADGYEPQRGDVHVVDGTYYRVHISQRNGFPYVVSADILAEAVWGTDDEGKRILVKAGRVDWVRAPGQLRKLSAATQATAAESAAFGALVGRCCFCSTEIDTPESTAAGYGPKCAVKYGLPWGNK